MALLIVVLISDLAQVCLNALLPIGIICRITSKDQGTRNASIDVFLLLLLPSVFLLLFPCFVRGLGILSLIGTRGAIWDFGFLSLWLRLFDFRVLDSLV